MDPALRKAARHLQTSYDLRAHGQACAAHAQALDAELIDRFGIVGPLETWCRVSNDWRSSGWISAASSRARATPRRMSSRPR